MHHPRALEKRWIFNRRLLHELGAQRAERLGIRLGTFSGCWGKRVFVHGKLIDSSYK